MRPDQPVLIAGGGIGGLALAVALARRGVAAHVLERRAEFSEAGAGIQLSPNAVRVLQRLGIADALAAVVGVPEAIIMRHGASGRTLQRLPLGVWIENRHGAPYWMAHRRDLQAALLGAAQDRPLIRISTNFDVAAIDTHDDARVCATSAAGHTVEGIGLIGADGVFSRVRGHLGHSAAPRFSGLTAARTVLTGDAAATVMDRDAVGVWLAPGAHVVHYPVRSARDLAVVVITPATTADAGWALPISAPDVGASLAGFAPVLHDALGGATEWRRWALFELDQPARWSVGRVTLLGDAAHPMLPFLAQGAALALEDALVLADQIAATTDIASAFATYEALRMRRARAVVATARRNGRIFHLDGLAAKARDITLRLLPPQRVMARYDWVYGWT